MSTARTRSLLLVLGAAAALAAPASAGFTNPYTPPFRGQPFTEYGYWESFTYPFGGLNLPDEPNATTLDATLEQFDLSAFLTGGNIYSFQAPIVFELSDTVPSDLQEVALQISTKGSELDYAGVVLSYVDGQGQTQILPWTSYTELAKYPNFGFDVESLFVWDLSGVADEVKSYSIAFQAAAASMSLDAVVLDTRAASPVVNYCTAKVNSQGCLTSIGYLGSPSASSASAFVVSAQNLMPKSVGILIYGTTGPAAVPFQGGFVCMAPPVHRTPGQSTGGSAACSGTLALDFNALIQSGGNPALVAGAKVQTQFWSRDTGFAPPNASNLTDALEFVIQP